MQWEEIDLVANKDSIKLFKNPRFRKEKTFKYSVEWVNRMDSARRRVYYTNWKFLANRQIKALLRNAA